MPPCNFHTSDRTAFVHHIAGGAMDHAHSKQLDDICADDIDWMDKITYISEAIAVAERERDGRSSGCQSRGVH